MIQGSIKDWIKDQSKRSIRHQSKGGVSKVNQEVDEGSIRGLFKG